MTLKELGHAEGTDLVLSKDRLHLLVGLEELLVLGVLELLLLDVGPEPLDHLRPGQLLALLGPDEVAQVVRQGHGLCQTGSLRHLVGCRESSI